jgi:hypothetical protein
LVKLSERPRSSLSLGSASSAARFSKRSWSPSVTPRRSIGRPAAGESATNDVNPAAELEQGADEAFDSPMSSVERWGYFCPGVEAAVDDVGEVAFNRAARFARCLALGDLPREVGAGWWVAGLDDGYPVESGVELAVAAAVESVAA